MTLLYDNRGLWRRNAILIAVVIVAMLWGLWELWHAAHGGDQSSGAMFGVLFLAGGAYSFYQLWSEQRDVVTSVERDAAGALTIAVWRLQGPLRLAGPFANWRPHVKLAGRQRQLLLYVDAADHPRPLRFELGPKSDLAGLRTIAPEAMAEYEAMVAGKTSA
jgi:hypothetical protein